MNLNKKSQMEIQFNWIFVLIVGIVFLAFFFMLISSQTKSNDIKVSASLVKHFRTIIDTTAQKSGTVNEYTFPSSFQIDFECDSQRNIYEYRLNDYKVADIKYDVMFAPRQMVGQNVYTWTREWELPENEGFTVSNVLYVTNKRHGYIFINGTNTPTTAFRTMFSQFPKNISVEVSDGIKNFAERNYDNYTYILFKEDVNQIQFNDITGKTNYIVIEPTNPNNVFDWGNIYFCDNQAELNNEFPPTPGSTKSLISQECEETQYLGSASLYGAIFSTDEKYYNCMMTKAFKKLRLITLLQYYRIENFNKTVGENPNNDLLGCIVNLGLGSVPGPYTMLKALSYDETAILNDDFGDDGFSLDKVRDTINTLQTKNRILSLDTKCIKLY